MKPLKTLTFILFCLGGLFVFGLALSNYWTARKNFRSMSEPNRPMPAAESNEIPPLLP